MVVLDKHHLYHDETTTPDLGVLETVAVSVRHREIGSLHFYSIYRPLSRELNERDFFRVFSGVTSTFAAEDINTKNVL